MDHVDATEHPLTLSAAALVAQGMARQGLEDAQGAKSFYEQALALDPRSAEIRYLMGSLAVAEGRYDNAQEHLRHAYDLNPDHGPCAYLQGHVLHKTGQPAAALPFLDRAFELAPANVLIQTTRAQALFDLERFAETVQACDEILALKPDVLAAHFIRGGALIMMGRPAEALQSYDHVLRSNPGDLLGHYMRAQAWVAIAGAKRCDDALVAALDDLKQILILEPQYPNIHGLYAFILRRTGELDTSIPYYEEAIRQDPSNENAQYGLAEALLSQGDWARGWKQFEHRLQLQPVDPPPGAKPWKGEPLDGKSIMLVPEGGLGDVLHCFRYVRPVSELAASVSITLPNELRGLLDSSHRTSPATQSFDYYSPMMSLPMAFDTRPDTVPAANGYIMANAAKTAQWRQRLSCLSPKLHVGLAWSGNPAHANDHNRSMRLSLLSSLFEEDDVAYISLQQVVRHEDRETLAKIPQLAFFGPELQDFDDTAALCEAMDLIVSVDTSVAHLAGALGKPVWIMLPAVADYRWMTQREDTPWYSRARLFRQPRRGDWAAVVARVRSELRQLATNRLSPGAPAGATSAAPKPR